MRKKLFFSCLWLLFGISQIFAQQRTITGTVMSPDRTPLEGASVVVAGQKTGASTGTDGKFSLSVPTNAKQIQISYVGSVTKKIDLTSNSGYEIILEPSSEALTDVVVVGYGSIRKKDLTGAVASISSKEFNTGQINSPEQLLQGKVSGLQITNSSGQPGGITIVKIRGNNAIRTGKTP